MLFHSYIFVFVFLPVSLGGYYLAGRIGSRAAKLWLAAMSLWFYGSFRLEYLLLLLLSVFLNYGIALGMKGKKRAGGLLAAGVAVNLAALVYFKYMDFFIGNWNYISGMELPLLHVALPVGISFFTFQQISYLADCYKGEIETKVSANITFFIMPITNWQTPLINFSASNPFSPAPTSSGSHSAYMTSGPSTSFGKYTIESI